MNIDGRIEALTMNLELFGRNVETLRASVERLYATVEQDGVNIRALARIAEIHERRLTSLEDSGPE